MKLSVKLAIYITVLAVLSSGVVTVNSSLGIQKRVDQSVSESISSLVKTVYSMAATSTYVVNEELAREVIEGLEYNDTVACAMIQSDSMTVFSSTPCEGEPDVTRKLLSPWDDAEVVGELLVYKDDEFMKALAQEQAKFELYTMIKLILIISASILFITYFLITKPIERVSKQLGKVRFEKDVDLLDEGARKDEIGDISRVINLMLANAKKQIISEQLLARRTQELSNHFRLIFELSKNYLAVTDNDLRLKYFNPRFEELLRFSRGERPVMHQNDWLGSISEDPDSLRALFDSVQEPDVPTTTEIECSYNNGSELVHNFFSLTFVKSNADGHGMTVLIFITDITEHRRKLLETEYEASHDNLTKLYNRLAATRKIRHMLSGMEPGQQVAILFIDLDGFKKINDDLGHDAGDTILRVISTRIKYTIRKTDIACRWGGDEFLVALSDVTLAQATKAANKLLQSILEPITIKASDEVRSVGASIGLALSSDEVSDFSTLYDQADRTMYQVKKSGKNAVLVHSR